MISTGSAPLTELIPVAVNPGNNCLPLPKVMLESLFVDSCFYPAERARSGPDE